MKNTNSTSKIAGTLLLGLAAANPVMGAGFQLAERSGSGLGRAFSGEAAIGDDASIIASNPAGMSLLDDMSFAFGANVIIPTIDVTGISPNGTAPGFSPNNDQNVASDALVPYMFMSKKINDQWTVGFGSYTTYGLKSDYSQQFASQSGTDFSELFSFNLNPALSYKVNNQWTLGAGLDLLYAKGNINSKTFPAVPTVTPANQAFLVGTNLFNLEGDDWGFGYNLGVLYEVNEGTRFGLHYRSSIELTLNGASQVGPALGGPVILPTTLDVEMPDTIEFSAYHEIDDKWAVHGDVMWTNWSKFQSLAPKTGNAVVDAAVRIDENWTDAFRFAVGATYKHSDRLTFRTGVAYDESPVSTPNRTLRIPDADRIWASIGLTYKLNDCYNLDLGYTHIFADTADIQFAALGGNEDAFQGKAEGSVDLFAIGLSGSF
ncbi:MAG: OmpP1/FadL family transporter [Verrucomicrobiaceae bacterium]